MTRKIYIVFAVIFFIVFIYVKRDVILQTIFEIGIQSIPRAEQININQLSETLDKLKNNETEFNFFGITSNGIDCIYFFYENGKFNLEFEAIVEGQIQYIQILEEFAQSNNYKTELKTYGNTPYYDSENTAPVLRIETKASLNQMAFLGQKIQNEIFGNNLETIYNIVP